MQNQVYRFSLQENSLNTTPLLYCCQIVVPMVSDITTPEKALRRESNWVQWLSHSTGKDQILLSVARKRPQFDLQCLALPPITLSSRSVPAWGGYGTDSTISNSTCLWLWCTTKMMVFIVFWPWKSWGPSNVQADQGWIQRLVDDLRIENNNSKQSLYSWNRCKSHTCLDVTALGWILRLSFC